MNGWVGERMDGKAGGWMNGWMDRRAGKWMGGQREILTARGMLARMPLSQGNYII